MTVNKGAKIDGDPAGSRIEQEVQELENVVFESKTKISKPRAETSKSEVTPPSDMEQLTKLVAAMAEQSRIMAEQLKISASREARLKQKEDEQDARKQARDSQYKLNGAENEQVRLRNQAKCRHLKGIHRKPENRVDYNLSIHTFANGVTRIRCLNCGMNWFDTDTKTRIIRNGKIFENHTGLSWLDMLERIPLSSNKATSSEVPKSFMQHVKVFVNPEEAVQERVFNPNPIGVVGEES